jgi:hypothetical protein
MMHYTINNIQYAISYFKLNTCSLDDKDQSVNAVQENDGFRLWQSHETKTYYEVKMWFLYFKKLVVRVVTTLIWRVNKITPPKENKVDWPPQLASN